MWTTATAIFWVALFIGLFLWNCPLPELKKPAGDAAAEPNPPPERN